MLYTKINSNILRSVTINEVNGDFTVELGKKNYTYLRVEMKIYLQMCKSLEPIKFYNTVIKGKYERKN